ncbi:RNA polymerase sigma factor [Zhouia sp. PK063]|uniref:RNA polymerase sigma factor n=1 Tax=Zhouia sp. PK063 TaxID=3373602 RepID=UPI0037ACA6D7
MTNHDDQYYITKVCHGDTHAFSVLVQRYKNLVYTLCYRMLKNNEEAEEVAQDSFIKIYNHLTGFKGEAKFSTWVYKITYYSCLDHLKKLKRQHKETEINELNSHQIATVNNALDVLEEQEQQAAIQECLLLLNGDDAFMLTLFYFEECSVKEIAKITNTSVDNVKIKLFRARKRLATILKEKLPKEMINVYER